MLHSEFKLQKPKESDPCHFCIQNNGNRDSPRPVSTNLDWKRPEAYSRYLSKNALENYIMRSSIISENNITTEKIPMLDYNSMDNNSDLEKPMQNPQTAMETFQKSIPAVIIIQDIRIDDLGYIVKK